MEQGDKIPQRGGMLQLGRYRDWRTGRLLGGLASCDACGWEGWPTIIKGEPSTECPECESKPYTDALWEEVLAEPKRRTYGQHFSTDEPGRNDPCPCGSGRKYKKCHGG